MCKTDADIWRAWSDRSFLMLPALLTAGASLLGSHLRNKEAKKASARQMAFQEDMSNTSYQRGMEDMRKAGLNPILAGKLGGASTPTGSTYNPENITQNATNAFLQTMQTQANVEQTEAQTAKIMAETDVIKNTSGSFIGRNVDFAKKEVQKTVSSAKESNLLNNVIDKIKESLRTAKSKQINKQLKRSGSKTLYKNKKVYPDRIMRMK